MHATDLVRQPGDVEDWLRRRDRLGEVRCLRVTIGVAHGQGGSGNAINGMEDGKPRPVGCEIPVRDQAEVRLQGAGRINRDHDRAGESPVGGGEGAGQDTRVALVGPRHRDVIWHKRRPTGITQGAIDASHDLHTAPADDADRPADQHERPVANRHRHGIGRRVLGSMNNQRHPAPLPSGRDARHTRARYGGYTVASRQGAPYPPVHGHPCPLRTASEHHAFIYMTGRCAIAVEAGIRPSSWGCSHLGYHRHPARIEYTRATISLLG